MNHIRHLTRAGIIAGATAAALAVTALAPTAHADTITIKEPTRHLHGWQSEWVPQYQCPSDHRYLLDQSFAPFGIQLLNGVQVSEGTAHPWPINPFIETPSVDGNSYALGIYAGTATNWIWNDAWYEVQLHCTNDLSQAYQSSGEIL